MENEHFILIFRIWNYFMNTSMLGYNSMILDNILVLSFNKPICYFINLILICTTLYSVLHMIRSDTSNTSCTMYN